MSLIGIVLALVIVGVVLWLINTFIPMAPPIRTVLNVFVTIVVCIWLLQTVGLLSDLRGIRFTR
jgi:hypothetical protein